MLSLNEIHSAIFERFQIKMITPRLKSLDHFPISNVTIMETLSVESWANGGEFLLTSSDTFPQDINEQIELLETLKKHNIPCLAIKPLYDSYTLDTKIIERAEKLQFPLFIIPNQVTYLGIMNYINALLFNTKEYDDFRERAAFNIILKDGILDDLIIDSFHTYEIDIVQKSIQVFDVHLMELTNDKLTNASFNALFKITQLILLECMQSERIIDYLFIRQLNSFTIILIGDDQSLNDLNFKDYISNAYKDNQHYHAHISAGLSNVGSIANITSLLRQANFAVVFSKSTKEITNIEHYNNIEFIDLIYSGLGTNLDSFVETTLRSIRKGSVLFETLSMYFQCNEHLVDTSKKLFIHINTLNYRLRRIENVTGLKLASSQNKVKLYLATLAEINTSF